MADRNLVVRFIGDDRDLQRAFTSSERGARSFETRMGRVNQTARGFLSGFGGRSSLLFGSGAFLGSAALSAGLTKSVQEASALNEEIAKSQQIFGAASADVERFADSAASSLGISRREALQATGIFGNLFRVVELAPQRAAAMSQGLVQLAADLASFNNADPSDVLQALRSGLIGEAEPLRRYGVLLSEARVQQQALVETGKTNVRALTDQEKAIARYNLILEDTAPAQGDVARTSGSLANQTRQLNARLDDLAAQIGGTLIPVLELLTTAANGAFDALEKVASVEVTGGVSVGDIAGWVSGWNEINFLIDEATKGMQEASQAASEFEIPRIGEDVRESPGEIAARNRAIEATRVQAGAKRFSDFVKGLGLKLDRAGLTAELDDDIAALEELERAVLRQIAREGRTFDLVEQLTQTRLQLSSLREQRASAASAAAREAYAEIIDALNLRLEQALRTASLEDDLRALSNLENAIRRRIQAEGRTIELLRQLDGVRAQREEVLREQRERRQTRRQERQFLELGLTAEGDQPTPGAGALRRRANTLEDQIKGTVLDTAQTRGQLDRIQSVLSGEFGKVGKNVREAIQRMLREISEALKGDRELAPDTPGAKRGIDRLIEGLGLSPDQVKELRQRFAGIDAGVPGITAPTLRTGGAAGFGGGAGGALIDLNLTVEIDGQQVEATVTRKQEKRRGRTAGSRRGVRPGRM